MLKRIGAAIWTFVEAFGKARAAHYLSLQGHHDLAKKVMLS